MRVSGAAVIASSLILSIHQGARCPALAGASGKTPSQREIVDPSSEKGTKVRPPFSATGAAAPARQPFPTDEELQIIPEARRIMPPPLPADLEWVRSPAISLEMLKGRVVLLEVWEASCVNCLRSLPSVSRLHAQYARLPFIVIGIHAPEYRFNATRGAVERASRRLGLEFPIASDARRSFWNSWAVGGWPTTYLLDAHGRLAHIHQGEFAVAPMEQRIRKLILESWPSLRLPEAMPSGEQREPYAPECGFVTPDIPTRPGLDYVLNPEGYRPGETIDYADPGRGRSEGTIFLKGPWSWLQAGLQRGSGPGAATVGVTYTAKEVYAVISLVGDGPLEVEIRQDGRPLTDSTRGQDVELSSDGRSVLRLRESRLHYLAINPDVGRHDLELTPSTSAFVIHGFSFGNRCQTDFPHR